MDSKIKLVFTEYDINSFDNILFSSKGERMKKRRIIGSLMICCMALVTAAGCTFSRKLAEEKPPNVFLASEHNNMKTQDKNPGFICSESYTNTDNNNENNQRKSGDCIQGLILTPKVITKTICENYEIISN